MFSTVALPPAARGMTWWNSMKRRSPQRCPSMGDAGDANSF